MLIRQLLNLLVLTILSMSQISFSMENQNKKNNATQSKFVKKLEPQAKKQKIDLTDEADLVDEESCSFNYLPFELKYKILLIGLKSIIKNNVIFSPLDGVKEFLDSIALVNNEFNEIAADFGRNNKVFGDATEPRYKAMVKKLWLPTDLGNENVDYLSNLLGCTISPLCVERLESISAFLKMVSTKDLQREALLARVLASAKAVKFDCPEARMKWAAQLLIAGADSNYSIMEGCPYIIFCVSEERLHTLIPLLLTKHVDAGVCDCFGQTPLMYAVRFPKIVKMLLDYDPKTVSCTNNAGRSALDLAVEKNYSESMSILLNHFASICTSVYK